VLVLIVGGGPAGVATSLSLAHSAQVPTKTLFIDNGDPARFRVGESLPPEALKILKFLCGPSSLVCRSLGQDHSPSVGKISLWGSTSPETVDSIINPLGPGGTLTGLSFRNNFWGSASPGPPRDPGNFWRPPLWIWFRDHVTVGGWRNFALFQMETW